MSDRIVGILLAFAGVLAVTILALLGYDAWHAARTGPRWRRRLVGAGLSFLALLGVAPAVSAAEAPSKLVAADGKPLAESPEWKSLDATWREASEVASGKRGPYPFDAAGKKRLLESLSTSASGIDALRARGLLSESEAGLVKHDLGVLVTGVQSKRPTEMKMATCYAPMPHMPVQGSLNRLAARLPLLEKLAAAEKVQPSAVKKILGTITQDLAVLSSKEGMPLSEADQVKAEQVRKAVSAHVARLQAAVGE